MIARSKTPHAVPDQGSRLVSTFSAKGTCDEMMKDGNGGMGNMGYQLAIKIRMSANHTCMRCRTLLPI